jgi:hypothetical protein
MRDARCAMRDEIHSTEVGSRKSEVGWGGALVR